MRIRNPGKVRDNLWYLGHMESGIYFLEDGDEAMIINGGLSSIVPAVLRQIEEFGLKEGKITKLLILHSHFDHVGIVPFFKRRHPNLEIYASARAWKILEMQNAIDTINEFSRSVMDNLGLAKICSAYDLNWRDDVSGITVSEGDCIRVGDTEMHVIETPGHSSCSISGYAPQLKALFPTDSAGIPFKEILITSGNSNYTQYQESLEKLKDLEADYVCADHYGYVIGDEAGNFISRTIEVAREHRSQMEETYRRTGNTDTAAQELTTSFFAEHPDYFLSQEILGVVYRQMIRHIAKATEGQA
jgi:glyoxylase-like metal-dependent hydrolase (beta-lactamase superfamily II)